MPKISVITPTVRPEGLVLVQKALRGQSFHDFEWIIVYSGLHTNILEKTGFTGFDSKIVLDPGKKKGDIWSLNKAYNAGIRVAKGELIVSWQDYTFSKSGTLETFWQHYLDEPKTLVSAVGNKYESDSWDVMTWKDPREREDIGSFYPCYFQDIEWNLCSIPKQALYDVGGFDEGLDKWYGMDGYSVNERILDLGGYDFKLDQSIKSYSLEHGRLGGKDWDKKNALNGPYEKRREQLKKLHLWPQTGYLTKK